VVESGKEGRFEEFIRTTHFTREDFKMANRVKELVNRRKIESLERALVDKRREMSDFQESMELNFRTL